MRAFVLSLSCYALPPAILLTVYSASFFALIRHKIKLIAYLPVQQLPVPLQHQAVSLAWTTASPGINQLVSAQHWRLPHPTMTDKTSS